MTSRSWAHKVRNPPPLVAACLILAVIALAVRITYFLIIRHGGLTYSDSSTYSLLAEQLSKGAKYAVTTPGTQLFPVDLLRPPGYPAFLAIVNGGSHVSADRTAIMQAVLGAASVGLVTWLVGSWLGIRVGIVAGALLAFDWATVLFTPLILADFLLSIVYAAAIASFAVFLHRKRVGWAILSGLVLGLAALVKPAAEFGLVAVLLAILISPRGNWRGGLACLLSFLVITLPWAFRNQATHGVFALSTISSVNAYDFTAQVALRGPLFWTPAEALQISDDALRQLAALHLPPAKLKSRMDSATVKIISHHGPKVIVQAALGAFRTGLGTARDTLANSTHEPNIPTIVGTLLPLGQIVGMWVMAAVGAVSAWRRRRAARDIMILLIAGLLLIILPAASPVANARFRIPATPLLVVLAAIGVITTVDAIRVRTHRKSVAADV